MDFLELIQKLHKTLCGHVQGCAARRAASSVRMSFRSKLFRLQSKIETKSPIKEKRPVDVMFCGAIEIRQSPNLESVPSPAPASVSPLKFHGYLSSVVLSGLT